MSRHGGLGAMSSDPVPAATYGQFVKFSSLSDGTLRLVVDVPHERANAVLAVLGFPAGQDIALVPLSEDVMRSPSPTAEESRPSPKTPDGESARTRTPWHETPRVQQAGMRCHEPKFVEFLLWGYGDILFDSNAAQAVRDICGVHSRAELGNNKDGTLINPRAADRWDRLDDEYRAWAGLEAETRG